MLKGIHLMSRNVEGNKATSMPSFLSFVRRLIKITRLPYLPNRYFHSYSKMQNDWEQRFDKLEGEGEFRKVIGLERL